jgi:hypothetical protein
MSSPLLLNGNVDNRDETISALRRQLAQMDEALRLERIKTGQVEAGARELRHVLSPLYRGLQKIFGELDEAGIDGNGAAPATSRWELIKQRNPGRIAQAIDVLLLHGTMNTSQLAAAMRMDRSNCGTNVVQKLKSMGLIVKNGNEFSLRELP